ncbi:hypothetical protein [Nocardioides cavernaquae]|uniref:Anti-sigma factor n=1 Tax=Nocardioides cavernaquae TaxID=2321396 RepID=A0A3A5HBL8_9ACTN|nr:hypothetical protein [Nocardioides cavernaquae]RJS46825.1 hypothetical protein D4739_11785 [Nocardioides cavernaquae]
MTGAVVACRHQAALGAGAVAALPAHADCAPPVTRGTWQVAAPGPVAPAILDELEAGCSLAGALLRLADREPGRPLDVLVSDGSQVAACGTGLHLLDLGRGEYAVSAMPPARHDEPWAPVPACAVILIDPCGVTTTILHPTPLEPTR